MRKTLLDRHGNARPETSNNACQVAPALAQGLQRRKPPARFQPPAPVPSGARRSLLAAQAPPGLGWPGP